MSKLFLVQSSSRLGNHDLFSATAAFFHGSSGNRSSFFFSGNISTKALWQFYEDKLNRVDLSWVFCCFDSLVWTSFSGDFGMWPSLEESRAVAIQIEFIFSDGTHRFHSRELILHIHCSHWAMNLI